MGLVEAKQFGVNAQQTRFGEPLMAQDGNGDLYEESTRILVPESYRVPVTPEEVSLLIYHGARRDIARRRLEYPPEVERALELAAEFYETYLYDMDMSRIEVIDRYTVALIEQLVTSDEVSRRADEEFVERYVRAVHGLSLAA